MSGVDQAFERARARVEDDARLAFADWMGRVERPIRESLRRFARAVDVEVVIQESFLRMWILARDPVRALEGENASLRFALRLARNVALEEVRRARLDRLVPLEALGDGVLPGVDPEPTPDPGLARVIEECLKRLSGRCREALLARLDRGHRLADRDLAAELRMTLNTFLQNIVRARRGLMKCLASHGVPLEDLAP